VKILVIEDDSTVGRFVQRGLEEHRANVDLVSDGAEGLERGSRGEYDVIVLDLRLPSLSGIEVLRTLRDRGVGTPVLILTAQDAVDSKIQALRIGADDYVTKPFSFEELLARVEALGRRPRAITSPTLQIGDLTIDTGSREVKRGDTVIELTPKEYVVLEYLARNEDRVLSRTLITEYAWGYNFDPGTNIVDVVINRLRKKIQERGSGRLIHTVRGVGYVLRA
jgi:two-component system copper resistance phosphate regulon response regulator CusR